MPYATQTVKRHPVRKRKFRSRLWLRALRFRWRRLSGYENRNVVARSNGYAVVHYDIASPPAAKGRRLVFFSDTHFDDANPPRQSIADLINAQNPDWIVFGGDLLTYTCRFDQAAALLTSMKASTAKIAVMGNWENKRKKWLPSKIWRDMYKDAGFTLLVNEFMDSHPARFAGVGLDPKLPTLWVGQNAPEFTCLLAHKPDHAVETLGAAGKAGGVQLCLSGHTHGGQIRIPFFGAIRTRSIFWKKFEYGLFEHKRSGAKLIVSSGLGQSGINLRIFCEPEIVVVNFT